MPQFCILFYAIIRSWRPKGGAMAQCPPSIRPCLLVVAMEMINFKFIVGNQFDVSRTRSPALNSLKWYAIGSLGNWYYRMNDACIGLVHRGAETRGGYISPNNLTVSPQIV